MATTIKHRKQSVLASAGYDVDVPQWNDSHVLDGGTNGQVLVRDTTQADGWKWGDGAPLVSPAFTGTPTAPTAAAGTNTTQVSTTAFVQAALSSGQITFPATQVPSSNPNVLDDYEEGPWTPILTADGSASGQVYTMQLGLYTKVGRLVVAQFQVILSNKGTLTGFLQIGGLPMFGSGTVSGLSFIQDVAWGALATAYVKIGLEIVGTSGKAYLRGITAASTDLMAGTLTGTNVGNTSSFYGVAAYMVS